MSAADPDPSVEPGVGEGLRVGLVGCGSWGVNVLRACARSAARWWRSHARRSRGRAPSRAGRRASSTRPRARRGRRGRRRDPETAHAETVAEALEARRAGVRGEAADGRSDLGRAARAGGARPPLRDGQVALSPRGRGASRPGRLGRARAGPGDHAQAPRLGQRAPDERFDLAPGPARPLDHARDPRVHPRAAVRGRRAARGQADRPGRRARVRPVGRDRGLERVAAAAARGQGHLPGRNRLAPGLVRGSPARRPHGGARGGAGAATDRRRDAARARARRVPGPTARWPAPALERRRGAANVAAIGELRRLAGLPVASDEEADPGAK